ncbi:hypothetical protein C8T65DRAFT_226260 [Cerioporus squamosus]|nr:hypothetical protein C8T65DRAFT_226260 [Cerioporus squamosus]
MTEECLRISRRALSPDGECTHQTLCARHSARMSSVVLRAPCFTRPHRDVSRLSRWLQASRCHERLPHAPRLSSEHPSRPRTLNRHSSDRRRCTRGRVHHPPVFVFARAQDTIPNNGSPPPAPRKRGVCAVRQRSEIAPRKATFVRLISPAPSYAQSRLTCRSRRISLHPDSWHRYVARADSERPCIAGLFVGWWKNRCSYCRR